MKSIGISTKSFGFQEPVVPQMVGVEQKKSLFDKFATPSAPGTASSAPAPEKAAPSAPPSQAPAAPAPGLPGNAGAALDAVLGQVHQAKHPTVKASLIAAYVARHYLGAQPYPLPNPKGDAPPIQAQPYPYPLPNPKGDPSPPIQAQPYPYPLPNPKADPPLYALPYPFPQPEPYIGIPKGEVTILPVWPPGTSKDGFAASAARSLADLSRLIAQSPLPEGLQNTMLDRIATLLGQLPTARDAASQRTMVLTEVASLINILAENVPHVLAGKPATDGGSAVVERLKAMLFAAAVGRGDVLDVTSHVA